MNPKHLSSFRVEGVRNVKEIRAAIGWSKIRSPFQSNYVGCRCYRKAEGVGYVFSVFAGPVDLDEPAVIEANNINNGRLNKLRTEARQLYFTELADRACSTVERSAPLPRWGWLLSRVGTLLGFGRWRLESLGR